MISLKSSLRPGLAVARASLRRSFTSAPSSSLTMLALGRQHLSSSAVTQRLPAIFAPSLIGTTSSSLFSPTHSSTAAATAGSPIAGSNPATWFGGASSRSFHSSAVAEARASSISHVGKLEGVLDDEKDESGRRNLPVTELRSFLGRVYSHTGYGVMGMFGASGVAIASGLAFTAPMPLMLGGFVGAMGSSFFLGEPQGYEVRGEKGLVAVDSAGRKLAFATLVSSFGLMTAPVLGYVAVTQPMVVPAAVAATLVTMGGAGVYALRASGDSINAWGPALTGGLFGLIGVSLGGMGASYLGYDQLASALFSVNTYGGVLVFAGLTAYDTKIALDMHAEGRPDHLGAASMLFMDFANLFQRFLHIFMNRD